MAKEMIYEDDWWKNLLLFVSDENLSDENMLLETHENTQGEKSLGPNIVSDEIMVHGPNRNSLGEEKSLGANLVSDEIMVHRPNGNTLGEKSIVPNIATNEKYAEELDMGLIGGHDSGPNEVDDGSVRARKKGKLVVTENDGTGQRDHRTSKQVIHAEGERERRKKMTDLLEILHGSLPQPPTKITKAAIVEETVSTIKSLEETRVSLEKHILERLSTDTRMAPPAPSQTRVIENDATMMIKDAMLGPRSDFLTNWCSPNISLCVFGANASVNICSVRNATFFSSICYIIKKHNVDVLAASIHSDQAKTMYMMTLRVNAPIEIAHIFCCEDLFKLAVNEINYAYHQIL